MSTLRKGKQNGADDRHESDCPEAFEYHADVTEDAVARIQADASKADEPDDVWELVEGYDGK